MKPASRLFAAVLLGSLCASAPSLHAQSSDPAALNALRAAVAAELEADRTDHSHWMYQDHDAVPEKDAVYNTVETPQGSLRRMIRLGGQPLGAEAERAETDRIRNYVRDAAAQSRSHKNSSHDDDQATALLKMLPEAFLWNITEQSPEFIQLSFKPNPAFGPPNMEARVMGAMAGQLIIARDGNRIRTLRGRLTYDIRIGFGILGKLDQGGTFDVERREVGPGLWEITDTHVHIGGHALLFKTIGQQEDEEKTDWKPSPAHTLADAAHLLGVN